jgi:3',5'-cyclic AMP phosphodiesterase CpdA
MSTRRKFIRTGIAGIAGISLMPAINTFANDTNNYERQITARPKLRFAVASDLHYGEPGTDFTLHAGNMVKWLNADHAKNHLDFIIINGDLVFNNSGLLHELKKNYLDKLSVPFYTIPGNHDFADSQIWKNVFGYEDRYFFEHGDAAFILANTADIKGEYFCPDNAFIKNALDKFTDKKMVFIVMHVPPVQWLKREEEYFLNCPDIVKLAHAYPNVKAFFHGHDHYLDSVRYTDKLPHFFDSHLGSNWGTAYRGYRIAEVGDDNTIYTYQVNASLNPVLNTNKF